MLTSCNRVMMTDDDDDDEGTQRSSRDEELALLLSSAVRRYPIRRRTRKIAITVLVNYPIPDWDDIFYNSHGRLIGIFDSGQLEMHTTRKYTGTAKSLLVVMWTMKGESILFGDCCDTVLTS